jgi:hypothetical protein
LPKISNGKIELYSPQNGMPSMPAMHRQGIASMSFGVISEKIKNA